MESRDRDGADIDRDKSCGQVFCVQQNVVPVCVFFSGLLT